MAQEKNIQDLYPCMVWIILEIFEKEKIPFIFTPSTFSTEKENKEAFYGDHYQRVRIILRWYYEIFKTNEIIPKIYFWSFCKRLQGYLTDIVSKRWEIIEQKIDQEFTYPKNQFSNIEQFPGFTQEIMDAEKKRNKNELLEDEQKPVGIHVEETSDEVEDLYGRFNKKR